MSELGLIENRPSSGYRYRAFLSYRSSDVSIAKWLHRKIEHYRVPRSLVGKPGARGLISAKVGVVFRDRDDARTAEDLETIIAQELSKSEQLIVLCSPRAVEPSSWVPREIELFRDRRPDGAIHSVIIDGEPPTCFPAPLLNLKDETMTRVPLAADLRSRRKGGQDGRRRALTKIIASLIGAQFDELWRRERRRRLRNALITTAAVAGLTILVAGAFKLTNDISASRRLAAHAVSLTDRQFDLALLLAAEAYATSPTEEAEDAVFRTVLARPYFSQFVPDNGSQVAVSPDGHFMATGSGRGEVRLYELPSSRLLHTFPKSGDNDEVRALRFSKDGSRLAALSDGGRLVIFDARAHSTLRRFHAGFSGYFTLAFDYDGGNTFGTTHSTSGFRAAAAPVAFTKDGHHVAFVETDGTVSVADVDGIQTKRLGGSAPRKGDRRPGALSFSNDETALALASPDGIEVWRLDGSSESPGLKLDIRQAADVKFLDGRLLAVLTNNGRLRGVDVLSGKTVFDFEGYLSNGPTYGINDKGALLAWSASARMLISASVAGEIVAWTLPQLLGCQPTKNPTCEPLARFSRARGGYLSSLAISDDGKTLLSAGHEGGVERYALHSNNDLLVPISEIPNAQLFAVASEAPAAAFADGRSVVIVTDDGTRYEIPISVECRSRKGVDLALSSDARWLVYVAEHSACVYDLASPGTTRARTLTAPSGKYRFESGFIFNHDATRLVGQYSSDRSSEDQRNKTGDDDVGAVVWNLREPESRAHTIPSLAPVGFTNQATLVGRTGDGRIVEKDLQTGARLDSPRELMSALTGGWSFSARARTLYTTGNPGILVKSDLRKHQSEELFDSANRPAGEYLTPAVSADGVRVALANSEGNISLWTSDGRRMGSFFTMPGPHSDAERLAFGYKRTVLFVKRRDGRIYRLSLAPAEWASLARARAGRTLTQDERDRYTRATLRFEPSRVDRERKQQTATKKDPVDACFTRHPEASLVESEQIFNPLPCNETLRKISSVVQARPLASASLDTQVCELYARAIDELPLLLSGLQTEWAERALSRHDVRIQDAMVLIAVSGNAVHAATLKTLQIDDLSATERNVRQWALGFLARQGRNVSEKILAREAGSVTPAQLLAWPKCVHQKSAALSVASTGLPSWPHLRQTHIPTMNLSGIFYAYATQKGYGPAFTAMAEVLMAAREYDAARLAIARALRLQPKDGSVLNIAGVIELRANNCTPALEYFRSSLEVGRRDGWPQYNSAICLERLGRIAEAEASYAAALAKGVEFRTPDEHSEFLNGYAWFLVSHFGKDRAKLTVAETHAKEAVSISGGRDGNILDTLAAIKFATGDPGGAIELQTKAINVQQAQGKDVSSLRKTLDKYRSQYP